MMSYCAHHPVITALICVVALIVIVAMDYALFCMKRWVRDHKLDHRK